jgi:hypothetical protein
MQTATFLPEFTTMQVLRQWEAVREILYTCAHGHKPTQAGAWRAVQQRLGAGEVSDVLSLYVLSSLIVTQSVDVERGFSLLKDCLGLKRLSTATMTLDCPLRTKISLLPLTNGLKNLKPEHLEWITWSPEEGSSEANCVEIYQRLVLPNAVPLTVVKLHETLSMEKSTLWLDTLATEFETLGEIEVFADGEEEEQEQTDGHDVVLDMEESEMIHLLQYAFLMEWSSGSC